MGLPDKIKCILLVIFVQSFFAALIFFGFLLDPLIGVWVVILYFLLIGSILMHIFFSNYIDTTHKRRKYSRT